MQNNQGGTEMRVFEGNMKYNEAIKLIDKPSELRRKLVRENYLSLGCPKRGKFLLERPSDWKQKLKNGELYIINFEEKRLFYEVKK
jgi:hypothetical protein